MKKVFSFLTIVGLVLVSNCSRIPENNDPVIGIWSDVAVHATGLAGKSTIRKEWIFNDAYLGRYHEYHNNNIEVLTDFKWSEDGGTYTLSYPGLQNKVDDLVKIKESEMGIILEFETGGIFATRE